MNKPRFAVRDHACTCLTCVQDEALVGECTVMRDKGGNKLGSRRYSVCGGPTDLLIEYLASGVYHRHHI
jgi:hypothetical protein